MLTSQAFITGRVAGGLVGVAGRNLCGLLLEPSRGVFGLNERGIAKFDFVERRFIIARYYCSILNFYLLALAGITRWPAFKGYRAQSRFCIVIIIQIRSSTRWLCKISPL